MLLGFCLATFLSSSSAINAILISLANSRFLDLSQIFSISLGASVGSTVLVHFLSLKGFEFGFAFIILGYLLEAFVASGKIPRLGRALFSIGLLFFSLHLLSQSTEKLHAFPQVAETIEYLKSHPILSFLLATGFSGLIQSSLATIAFLISFLSTGDWTLAELVPFVLGANLGNSAMAFLMALKGNILAKRAALLNFISKVGGILLFLPLTSFLITGLDQHFVGLVPKIAWYHSLFNLGVAVFFWPWIYWLSNCSARLIPKRFQDKTFTLKHISLATPESIESALCEAKKEVILLSEIVEDMFDKCLWLFQSPSEKDLEKIQEMDKHIDFLNKEIKRFLTNLPMDKMTPEQMELEFEYLLRTGQLENIGDVVDRIVVHLAHKKNDKNYHFSASGWNELFQFHQKTSECIKLSNMYFENRNPENLKGLEESISSLEEMLYDFTEIHLNRLHEGVQASIETSSLHMDLLYNFHRIAAISIQFLREPEEKKFKKKLKSKK